MKATIESVLASSEFLKIALPEAIEVVAKANSQTVELTTTAFTMGVENVQKQVAKLLISAAKQTAEMFNAKCA
jgi:hypothetical protein